MAVTKTLTELWSGETFTASSAHADSADVDLSAEDSATVAIKITNGATGPTVPLGLAVWWSGDDSTYYRLNPPVIGLTANNGVQHATVPIPRDAKFIRIVNYQTNTGQNVTVDADCVSTLKT